MSPLLKAGCGLVVLVLITSAQPQTSVFDAATVKLVAEDGRGIVKTFGPNARAMSGGPGSSDPRRMVWGAAELKELFMRAWDVDNTRIVGPDWLDRPWFYRVEATMPPTTTKAQFQMMLQNLLIERLHLRMHHETRQYPGYELIVAPGGPKLTPAADHSDWPPLNAGAVDSKGCPILRNGRHEFAAVSHTGAVCLTYESVSMGDFSQSGNLNGYARLPDGSQGHIVDKTGLTGIYDFKLVFDGSLGSHPASVGARAGEAPTQDDVGSGLPTIFTALERQLGLRLRKANSIPLDTIVIEDGNPLPVGD